ncbi:uncharacterized protein TNCV_2137211 [Trichonephila clavipes]|nr:uncharacterized protein TNCV_2137211 [Trichonephila clavipes]
MTGAGWSARRVAYQLGRSDCVVRKRRGQWIREMSFNEDQFQDDLDRPVVEKTTTSPARSTDFSPIELIRDHLGR